MENLIFPDKDKYTERKLSGDVEANNLLEDVSKLWCIVSQDVESKEQFIFHNFPEFNGAEVFDPSDGETYTIPHRTGTFEDGVKFWYRAAHCGSKLIIHNCLTYDKPLLEMFFSRFKTPDEAWVDTYVQSKLQWFDRPQPRGAKGKHGLDAYGKRAGVDKPAVNDWSEMDAFKLHRCIQDVEIQTATYEMLEAERVALLTKKDIDFSEAWAIEAEYAMNISKQERRGALVDIEHVDWCIDDLDGKTDKLANEIEPNLPPTIVVKGKKLSRRDMAILFYGKRGEAVPEIYEDKMKDGIIQKVPVKDYYQPSMKFTKVVKSNKYSGFHTSYGESPVYAKKTDLSQWIKENYPETKPKDWGIEKEEVEEVVLNKNTCDYFDLPETATDIIVGAYTRVAFKDSTMSQNEVVKGYLVKLGWKHAEEWNEKKDSNKQKVRAEEDTEVRYPKKAAPENQLVRIVKKGQTIVTSPKLTEDDYIQLPEGVGKDIADYNSYMHRRRFLSNPKDPENKGLKAYVRTNGRIPCGVNNFNTATGRSSQSVWVNAPSEGALYGTEIRKCITAPEGKKVVGIDMKSAQLSIAAYYAKNDEYYNAVASGAEEDENGKYLGESAHCVSSRLFGLVSMEEWRKAVATQDHELIYELSMRRKFSKGASFGVIFGCSGKKLAVMLGVPEKEGNSKKTMFLQKMGLEGVQKWLMTCKHKYSRNGGYYIPLPMGYWVWCKMDHKAINYLIQGTEAVCQKLAVNYFEKKVKELGLDAMKTIDYHDEMLLEAADNDADEAGKIACEAYEYSSRAVYEWHLANPDKFPNEGSPEFMFNLDGGYKIGAHYGAVH